MSAEITVLLIVVFGILGIFALLFIRPKYSFYKKKYALQRGGQKRLEIKWRADSQQVIIYFDSAEIGKLIYSSTEERKSGKSISLPDGTNLNVKIVIDDSSPFFVTTVPDLTIDGKSVPDSINDSGYQIESASKDFYRAGVVNIVFGIIFSFLNPELAWLNILFVIPLGIAAFFVGHYLKRLSRTALTTGIVLAVLSGITFVIGFIGSLSTSTGGEIFGNLFDLIDTYLFISGLIKGFKAIDELEKEKNGETKTDEKTTTDDFSNRIESGYGIEVVMCSGCKTINSLSVVNCRTCQKDLSKENPIRNPYL